MFLQTCNLRVTFAGYFDNSLPDLIWHAIALVVGRLAEPTFKSGKLKFFFHIIQLGKRIGIGSRRDCPGRAQFGNDYAGALE